MDSLGEDRMWCKHSFGSLCLEVLKTVPVGEGTKVSLERLSQQYNKQSPRGLVYCLKLTELTEKHNQNEVCDK